MTAKTTHTKSDRSQIEEIKEKISLESVVSRYIKLKPVGKNLFGLCPFHKEDTPSFSVNTELNIYKCFGCGESGDVFSFLQKIESLEFIEVLEQLAQEAGVKLKMTQRDTKAEQKYIRTKQAHQLAAEFYNFLLTKHKHGKIGLKYLKDRKIYTEAIREFKIGYSPSSNTQKSLIKFLSQKQFQPREIKDMGLAVERYNRIVDKFSNRIMFPIFNKVGNIVGFSGRVIDKNSKRPKYLNTPETIIFRKRENLFGLYQSKTDIRKSKHVIVVEGQTDVISSWQVGIKNIVAPLGTSLTAEQLDKLKHFTENISICFDKDAAGQAAGMRAATLAYSKGFYVNAIEIPYGNDADETIQHDASLWKKAVKERLPAITFFLENIREKIDLRSINGKQQITKTILPIVSSMSNRLVQDHHLKEISSQTGIPVEILQQYIDKKKWIQSYPAESSTTGIREAPVSAETYLLSLLIQYPKSLDWATEKIPIQDISSKQIRDVISKLITSYRNNKEFSIPGFIKSLELSQQEICETASMRPIWTSEPTTQEITEEITTTLTKIKEGSIRKGISILKLKLANAESKQDTKLSNELLNTISNKIKELEALSTQKD